MAGPIPSPPGGDAVCWQCGAPARVASAYSLLLVASPRWGLSGLGHLVKRGERQDEVRIRVPRCTECRFRGLVSVAMTFVITIAGAVAAPYVQSRFLPNIDAPAGLHAGGSGSDAAATMIGVVLGFTAAMVGIALHRRLSGHRPLITYPPVIRLRRDGWHFPSSSAE